MRADEVLLNPCARDSCIFFLEKKKNCNGITWIDGGNRNAAEVGK